MTTLSLFPDERPLVESPDARNTPADLCADLGPFDLDVASNPRSLIRATRHYCLETGDNGLADPWFGAVWCNGPYSDPLPWCERLSRHDGPWAALWKADPTTQWWSVLMGAADGYALFRRRLAFLAPSNPTDTGVANFASVLFWGGGWQLPDAVAARCWPAVTL